MMQLLMKFYAQADPETLELLRRFIAKAFSTGSANGYVKSVLRRELDNVITVEQ